MPDACGRVARQQTLDALVRVGVSLSTAEATTFGNFMHLPQPQIINIFEMDLSMPHNPEPFESREHDFSTGVRDGGGPSEAQFEVFEQFGRTDGRAGWSEEDVAAAIRHFASEDASNDVGSGPGSLGAIQDMLKEFGENSFLSDSEMRALFLSSDYPHGFAAGRDARAKVCQTCAWPRGSTGACRFADASGVVKCQEPDWTGAKPCPAGTELCAATDRLPPRVTDVCAAACAIFPEAGQSDSCRDLSSESSVRCQAATPGAPCPIGTRFCPAPLAHGMLSSDPNATILP